MKLIESDDLGNWGVKGLPWEDLYLGQVITLKTYEKLYACLAKLMQYENVGPSPEQLEEIDELYQEKCKEVGQFKPLEGYVYNGQQLYIKESEGKMTNEEILAEIREAIDLNRIAREANNDALRHAENALRNKDYLESNYEKGVEAGLASYEVEMKKAYNKGLEVAWQLVKDLRYMDYDDKIECFGLEFDGQEKWLEIVDKFNPQEAIERLQAYKREQAEIKIGDVVRVKCGYEFVVTHISEDGHLFGICGKGDVYTAIPMNQCIKTGKHIDIQQMLNQIGGEEPCN